MLQRFKIIGYSANDEVFCPRCLKQTQGLAPDMPDYNGRHITPLYYGDFDLHEERCSYCDKNLVALLELREASTEPPSVLATLQRLTFDAWSLEFERIPPENIRIQLKNTGWRWSPRAQHWWTYDHNPSVPPTIQLPDTTPQRRVAAKPPIVRRHNVAHA